MTDDFPERDISQTFGMLSITFDTLQISGINESISVGAVVRTATISTEYESDYEYDRTYVQTTNDQFSLRTAYLYSGTPAPVDSGLLTTAELPYTNFPEITEVEVEQ